MTTLYLAWQDHTSRRWFPVGRLVQRETEPYEYEFAYTKGAEEAKGSARFLEIPGFPKLDQQYRASDMFPTFRNRVMNLRRPDRLVYLHQLGLDATEWDAISELSVSGGGSQADNFEVFPAVEPDPDGRFQTRFILHGLRHTNPDSIRRTETLEIGEALQVAFDLNNPAAIHAISVRTADHYVVGWLPRYLVDGLHQDDAWKVTDVEATVAQVNLDAPLSHRLLVDFSGKLPPGFQPMEDLPQYQPIAPKG